MKSSFKVGILALTALLILLFTVMWIKGKAISRAERVTVSFKDVNGMREGSGVQMMGVRIGQVEEIIPRLDSQDSYVDVKFVITEPDIEIPKASEISIQQSGIIGEQFLEITPPKDKIIYIPEDSKTLIPHSGDAVEMKLDGKYYDIGLIKKIEITDADSIPVLIRENIKTKNAYKIRYIVSLPGLVLNDMIDGKIVKTGKEKKLRLSFKDKTEAPYPKTSSPYTIIEPMRISDFLNLQRRSARSLIETNERISRILSDDVIKDLQQSAVNVQDLTEKAGITMVKAQELIDLSKAEIESLSRQADALADNLIAITDNLNKLAGDKEFVNNVNEASKAFTRVSNNVSDLMEDPKTKAVLANLEVISKNTAELSNFIGDASRDPNIKKYLRETVSKINTALDKLCTALDTVNYAAGDKEQLKQTIDDISESSENLKKFSEKLNKRFLIFRLLF